MSSPLFITNLQAEMLVSNWERQTPRIQHWLRTVSVNHIQRQVKDHILDSPRSIGTRPPVYACVFDLTPVLLLAPRDAAVLRLTSALGQYMLLDGHDNPEAQQHYNRGTACVAMRLGANTVSKTEHICDALAALYPTGDLTRVSVPQAVEASQRWTERLWRQEVANGGQTQVTCVVTHEGVDYQLHKLLDRAAYTAEGAALHHCVDSYWGKDCAVYSLRLNDGTRCATIEVRDNQVQQIRGDHNHALTATHQAVVDVWTAREGIRAKQPYGLLNAEVGHIYGMRIVQQPAIVGLDFSAIVNCEVEHAALDNGNPQVTLRGYLTTEGFRKLRECLTPQSQSTVQFRP